MSEYEMELEAEYWYLLDRAETELALDAADELEYLSRKEAL